MNSKTNTKYYIYCS